MKYMLGFYLLGVMFTLLSIFVRLIESLGGLFMEEFIAWEALDY
ncbi:Hypoxia-inducible lipid droplet-associated protein [Lemmus lemmus]